jgi:hypothetical protein
LRICTSDCPVTSKLLNDLSKFVKNTRKSTEKMTIHKDNSATLHRQNFTRWNSTFCMLLSFWTAFKKNVFSASNPLSVNISIEKIEKYIDILLPIFIISKNFQSRNASVCCVFPSILTLVESNLPRMELEDEELSRFRNSLVRHIRLKFEYELTSSIYRLCAILNVGKLEDWRFRFEKF